MFSNSYNAKISRSKNWRVIYIKEKGEVISVSCRFNSNCECSIRLGNGSPTKVSVGTPVTFDASKAGEISLHYLHKENSQPPWHDMEMSMTRTA